MTTLAEAIKIVEEAGGFVMMQGDLEQHDAPLTEARMDQIEEEERKSFEEFQSRRRNCHEALSDTFDSMLKRNMVAGEGQRMRTMSMYEMLEDVCLENGCDMDEIEMWLLNQ